MNYEEITQRFDNVRKVGHGATARCPGPGHDDQKNSLSITPAPDKTLLKCHAGCETESIIKAVGLEWRDLFADNSDGGPATDPVIKRYVYVDEQGQPLFRVCRTAKKDFFQERFENGAFLPKLNGTRRVVYNLPSVLDAKSVAVVEGEKDADGLQALGLVATTNAGGAGKWDDSYSGAFKGKRVAIIPDNDRPGREHALKVAKSLLPVAETVKFVELPGVPEKGDVSDYLATHTKDELIALIRATEPFTGDRPGQRPTEAQRGLWPEPMSTKEFFARPIDSTLYCWDKTLAAKGASIIVSQARDGKSYLTLNAGLAISRGVPFLGRETVKSPVLYISLDNSDNDVDQFLKELGATDQDQLFVQFPPLPDPPEKWLIDFVKRQQIKLVIIDTLQRFFHLVDSNAYAEAVNRMEPLDNLAKQIGFQVMYVHHSGKNNGFLGTTAFKAMCPTYLQLERVGDLQQRILTSDQRTGQNFESVAVGKDKNGWLQIVGTFEVAQINETVPKIREFLELQAEPSTEATIKKDIPGRGMIVSKAIRAMYRAGTLERIGEGRKGNPFRYYMAATTLNVKGFTEKEDPPENPSEDSPPKGGILKGGNPPLIYSKSHTSKSGIAGPESDWEEVE